MILTKIPTTLPAEIRTLLSNSQTCGKDWREHKNIKRLVELHQHTSDPVSAGYIQQYAGVKNDEWEAISKLAVYINLLKPAVRRLVSGVYGGNVTRTVEDLSGFKDTVKKIISPMGNYADDTRNWFESAVLCGTAARVWIQPEEGVFESWLPNPAYTEIICNPINVKDVLAVIEALPKHKIIRYATKDSYGAFHAETGKIIHESYHELNYFPGTVAYGQSRVHYGEVYGGSLVEEAADFSLRVTAVMLNLAVLQRMYSRSQMYVKGGLNNEKPEDAFGLHGVAELSDNGDIGFVSPDAKFRETLDIAKQLTSFCSTVISIPQESFDQSAVQPNESATASRNRNMPLSSLTKFLIEEWRKNEMDFISRGVGVAEKANPTLIEIKDALKLNISMEPASIPESKGEEVAAWIQLHTIGAKTPEDIARHFNPDASDDKIAQIVEQINKKTAPVDQEDALINQAPPKRDAERGIGETPN